MGIKFRCPNGHKLNVKEIDPATGRRVVGKVGYCPKCGARFRIPPGGQAVPEPSDSSILDDPAPLTAPDDSGALVPAHGPAVADRVRASTTGMRAAANESLKSSESGRAPRVGAGGNHAQAATAPAPSSSFRSAAPRWPALEEAPEAIWYVRPPMGGQYGPARGDVMRQWLLEGRVPDDALVWREGWPDWVAAGSVFPGLAELFASPQVAVGPVAVGQAPPRAAEAAVPGATVSQASSPARIAPGSVASPSRRRMSRPAAAAAPRPWRVWHAVWLLAGLCVVLGGVLLYLLMRS